MAVAIAILVIIVMFLIPFMLILSRYDEKRILRDEYYRKIKGPAREYLDENK